MIECNNHLHQGGIFLSQPTRQPELSGDVGDVIARHVLNGLEDTLDVVVLTPRRPQLDGFARRFLANLVQIFSQPRAQLLANYFSAKSFVYFGGYLWQPFYKHRQLPQLIVCLQMFITCTVQHRVNNMSRPA